MLIQTSGIALQMIDLNFGDVIGIPPVSAMNFGFSECKSAQFL
jgi:hypothetical protein